MCLIHDLAECIVGDLTPKDNVSKEEKTNLENVLNFFFLFLSFFNCSGKKNFKLNVCIKYDMSLIQTIDKIYNDLKK